MDDDGASAGPATPTAPRWQRREHRARTTDDYVFRQLIPYLGNKRRLLPLLGAALASTGVRQGTFVDLFTGSTVVARWAKTLGLRVLANDLEPYSHCLALGTVVPDAVPAFARLGGREAVLAQLDALRGRDGWVTRHLCPADDECADPDRERMFFLRRNGRRIDAVRQRLADWQQAGALDAVEAAHLLSALLYAACWVSNTSGVFKAYHAGWGGSNGTALHRIRDRFALAAPAVARGAHPAIACREDAQLLAPRLADHLGARADVVYLDPPYNQHPYASNYHLLNRLVLWDRPPLPPPTGGRGSKAAIDPEWRNRRSPWNHRAQALPALRALLAALDARFVLLSYSTEGNMPLPDLLAALGEHGAVRVFTADYKRYRVSPTRPSPRPQVTEFVAVVDMRAPAPAGQDAALLAQLRRGR